MKTWINSLAFLLISSCCVSQTDTLSKQKQWLKASIAPAALLGGSIYTMQPNVPLNKWDVQQSITQKYPNFHSSVDDYIWATPAALPYILDWSKKGYAKNDFWNRSIMLAKSQIIVLATVYPVKYLTKVERPDGSELTSYPSGHTAQAFMTATFMHEELKHQSIWYSIGAYSVATVVGGYRLLNNRHWLSDVLAGAAIGILSTKIAYLTHQYRWGKKRNTGIKVSFVPMFYPKLSNHL